MTNPSNFQMSETRPQSLPAIVGDEEFVTACYELLLRRQPDLEGLAVHVDRLGKGLDRLALVSEFAQCDEFRMIGKPEPWVPHGHYFSPFPSREDVLEHAKRIEGGSVLNWDLPGIDLQDEAQLEMMEAFAGYYDSIPFRQEASEGLRYNYRNESYPAGDAITLHCMLRYLRPKRMVEVGCGNSSCATLDTRDLFLDGDLDLTFIEPYPEFFHSLLTKDEKSKVRLIESRLQDVDLAEFERLQAGDVLFIDSTHISKLNSDVNHCLFEILPRIKPGVFVHIHDVFHGFEYPLAWLSEGRGWNEQYLLRAFLQFNDRFRIRYFTTYLFIRHSDWFARHMPLCLEQPGGSIWFEKTD